MELYKLTGAYRYLSELEDPEAFDAALDALQGDIADKAENIAALVRSLEAETEAHRVEAKRHADIAQARQNRTDRLKEYLKFNLEGAGLKSLKAGLFTVAVQANPPSVAVPEGLDLPEPFVKVIPEQRVPDKRALLDAYKAGEELPEGVTVTQGNHLRIR